MKDLQEDNLFDSVRERLGRYEEAPSDGLWGKIEKSKSRERVWPLFLEPMGVVLIGALLLFSHDDHKIENLKFKMGASQSKALSVIEPAEVKKQIEPSPILNLKSSILNEDESQPLTLNSKLETRNDSTETISPIKTENKIKKDSSTIVDPISPYKKPKSKFQFYLSITPSLSFNKIIPGSNDDIIVQGLAPRSSMSMKRFGFSIDAGVQREINKYFGFYGGLTFYHQQQELTYNYYDKDATVVRVGDEWVYDITREQHSKTFNYSMTTLGASSGVLVTLKGEKLKHKFGAGLMYTHSLNSSNYYVAYKLSYRNEIKISDRMSWFIEPTFVYSFIAKEKLNEPFTLKPYRAGITGGLLYRF